ncbi:MAG: hypothetical protein PGN16_08520 [Sphingomonas phyllosphaerae]|uniref:hypothetical protein n=1 Tax=Sphingomonas phyllosphaerae TaxID=257003 RepID=UPI002FFC5362
MTTTTNADRSIKENDLWAQAAIASQIAALCKTMADALSADPDASGTADAVDGLGTLARHLSENLNTLAAGEAL